MAVCRIYCQHKLITTVCSTPFHSTAQSAAAAAGEAEPLGEALESGDEDGDEDGDEVMATVRVIKAGLRIGIGQEEN